MLRGDVRLCPVRVLFVVLVTFFWLAGCGDDTESKLPTGKPCQNNTDCADNMCHDGLCASADPKENGASCNSAAECKSYVCSNSTCAPGTKPLGSTCLHDLECGSGSCSGGVCSGGTGPDAGVDAAPDGMGPDAGQPDGAQPDAAQPDSAQPDSAQPDGAQPDTAQPDAAQPDAAQPDAAQPDIGQPDTAQPDTGEPDTGQPDSTSPDSAPDACVPGGACTPADPCKTGEYQCPGGVLTCVETGNVTDGTSCGVGYVCQAGVCTACGQAKGDPCCSGYCGTNLTCVSGTCTCGEAEGQPCCGGTTCDANLTCDASTLCSCGKLGEACCGGTTCDNSNHVCAGKTCGCIVDGTSGYRLNMLRSDATVWNPGFNYANWTPVITATGSPFSPVKQVAGSGMVNCALKNDGTVWCYCNGSSSSCNYYGELGQGHFTHQSQANLITTQVMESASKALTDVKQISGGGYSLCALKNDGTVWCWGNNDMGQLGDGTKTDSAYAVQVLAASGGPAFSGAAQLAVSSYQHVCAKKTDNTLWCWGHNGKGELGIGSTTDSPFPAQVSALMNQVAQVSAVNQTTCAVTTDTGLWCWGDNAYALLGNGLKTGYATVPAAVKTGSGGTPFSGAAEVHLAGMTAVVGDGTGQLWFWGNGSYTGYVYYPQLVTTNQGTLTDAWKFGNDNGFVWYIRESDGLLWQWKAFGGVPTKASFTCP